MLIFLAIGVGVMTYHLLSRDEYGHHKKSKFDCHVTYEEDNPDKDKQEGEQPVDNVKVPDVSTTSEPGQHVIIPQRTTTMRTTTVSLGYLDEEIEIDDETETFEIPPGDGCERVTIMHDFTAGISAYRMWESELCFVKPLESECMPPWMLARRMSNPEYLRQHFSMVRENYVAVPPAIPDVFTLGPFVGNLCNGMLTYWLEEAIEREEEPHVPGSETESSEESESSDSSWIPSWWHHGPPLPPRHRGRRAVANLKVETNKETKIRYWDGTPKVKEMTVRYKVDE
uniref:Integral membrane protein 2 n=1 Tax=Saccoglossus kowalevskii TaxID=10224 RepID=A0ABM0MCY7_SACKO|nr:PREDICTED: uncharacterized protein LOC102809837 isoform X1 [Saccoglossus kowalevskii]